MTASGPFRPGELDGADAHDDELHTAGEVGRRIDATLAGEPAVRPSDGFADRVMGAVAREPIPSAAGFLAPLRRRSLRGVVASLEAAFGLAVRGGQPIGLRLGALAYAMTLLIVAGSATGLAAAGAAGAIGIISGDRAPTPTVESTTPPDGSREPGDTAEPGDTGEPGDTAEPGDTSGVEASDGSSGHEGASGSPDDHGGGTSGAPSPSSSADDHGGSSTADPSSTPKPSDTPRPSGTAKPTSSPG